MDKINWPKPGTYLLAVSGGVDSVVLLDVFSSVSQDKKYQLYVAHFDHGMRDGSADDAAFVEDLAQQYGIRFFGGMAATNLASEADARIARYDFLNQTAAELGAKVITAHHQDDLIETSLLNLARGTGRIGLMPFANSLVLRPLRDTPRSDILSYARQHKLKWHDDPTNADLANPRNFLRHRLMSQADPSWRAQYLKLVETLARDNDEIDAVLDALMPTKSGQIELPRELVMTLSQTELAELVAHSVRRLDPSLELDRRILGEIVIFAKAAKPTQWRPIRSDLGMFVQRDSFVIGNIVKNVATRRHN